jgi:replicative DNA helicase
MARRDDYGMALVPPHNVDAEQAVLGGLMLARDAYGRIADRLSPDDFYRADHRMIFEAIRALAESKPPQPYDAVTLGNWFEARGQDEAVAGGAYLVELASTTPSAANIEAYAAIVRDKAQMRRIIDAGTRMVGTAFQPEGRDSLEVIAAAQADLSGILQSEPEDMLEGCDAADQAMAAIRKRRDEKPTDGSQSIAGLSTGIADLDAEINGLEGGFVYVIAGRPGMGKSTLAQNFAEAVAIKQRRAVDLFTYEMPVKQYTERMLCSQSGVSSGRLRRADLEDVDMRELERARVRLSASPWRIAMPNTRNVRFVCAQSRRKHSQTRRGLIVVDYLQLMQADTRARRYDSRNDEITQISGALKQLAVELNVPVVVLSQLSREVEKRADKRPQMADLRDSGAIEQDADVILFVYRDEYYNRDSRDAGTAEIIIGKQRSGPSGHTVRVKCDMQTFRFSQLPFDWEPARREPKEGKPRGKRTGGGFDAANARTGEE